MQPRGALGDLVAREAGFGHSVLDGHAVHDIAVVDLLVARKILGDGLGRYVAQDHAGKRQFARLRTKTAQVAREDGMTFQREQARYADEQFHMVALHVPRARSHLARVGERGWIDKDQIPAMDGLALVADPLQHIRAHKVVLRAGKAIELHVLFGPVQIGVGKVDRHGLLDAAVGRVARGGAGVGKQVEKTACAFGVLAHQAARHAMVEEDAHIEIIVKVEGEGEAAFLDEGELAARDIGAFAAASVARVAGVFLGVL